MKQFNSKAHLKLTTQSMIESRLKSSPEPFFKDNHFRAYHFNAMIESMSSIASFCSWLDPSGEGIQEGGQPAQSWTVLSPSMLSFGLKGNSQQVPTRSKFPR